MAEPQRRRRTQAERTCVRCVEEETIDTAVAWVQAYLQYAPIKDSTFAVFAAGKMEPRRNTEP